MPLVEVGHEDAAGAARHLHQVPQHVIGVPGAGQLVWALLPPVVLYGGPIRRRGSCHPPARDGDDGRNRTPERRKAEDSLECRIRICPDKRRLSAQMPAAIAGRMPGDTPGPALLLLHIS